KDLAKFSSSPAADIVAASRYLLQLPSFRAHITNAHRAKKRDRAMDLGLRGKTAIVTGATANIGRAIAFELAAEVARLVAVGRHAEAGAKRVEGAKERGAEEAVFVAADLLDTSAPAKILAEAEKLGPVEVLINNVGGNVDQGFFVDSDPAK